MIFLVHSIKPEYTMACNHNHYHHHEHAHFLIFNIYIHMTINMLSHQSNNIKHIQYYIQ